MLITKIVDSKGRVSLGSAFANKTVIVNPEKKGKVTITLARVIPEREAWLYENPKTKASLARGLKQAKERKFVKAPNPMADLKKFGGDAD